MFSGAGKDRWCLKKTLIQARLRAGRLHNKQLLPIHAANREWMAHHIYGWETIRLCRVRALETNPYNFSAATAGATICFDLLLALQGGASPCEGPDEPDEGVYLQYRIGNGQWVTIHYFDPAPGDNPQLTNWNNWCFQLPQAALTSNVSIRWFQDNDSGADYDHWGLDNVQIFFNDPTFTISASNAQGSVFSFPQGSSGGDLPPQYPRENTTYIFNMTNTSGTTCSDSITIYVKDPQFEITAGRDTTVCDGRCVTLNSSAKVVKSYAQTRTFANTQTTAIATGIAGAATTINVAVAGMNNQNLQPGMIQSVCISSLTFFGFNLFPPGQQTLGDLRIRLICPDSSIITLVPAGVTTSSTPFDGYTNTCFTATSTTNIGSAAPPYTGSYQPNQSFNNLNGCSTNGVWKMEISVNNAASFGNGFFTGWSITLFDPEISYNGNFTWAPTTDMNNPTSPTPTICPTETREYVLTVTDTAGCKTVRDTVRIAVDSNCCNFTIAANTTQPSCGASNGAISITASPAGNYTYLWNDNNTSATRNNLPAGSYSVTVTDVANGGCERDTTIVLNTAGNLSLQLTNPVNPSCGQANGSVTVGLSGGTAPYVVTITNGGNTQTLNVPIAITQAVPNLPGGTYTVVVTDAQQCQQTQTITLTEPAAPSISSITATPETCLGDNDGTATVTAVGGSGALTYAWSNNGGTAFTATNLAPGNYTVTVTDGLNCSVTGNVSVAAGQVCCNINISAQLVQPDCGQSNGSIALTVSPQGNYSYAWSGGGSTTATNSNLNAGTYRVTVTDLANNCTEDTVFALSNPGAPTIDNVATTAESCDGNDGTLAVTATGPGVLTIEWSTGATDFALTGLQAGSYAFTVADGQGCAAAGIAAVAAATGCCNFTAAAAATDATCAGNDGSIAVSIVTQGTAPYTYSIDGVNYQQGATLSGLVAGVYDVYVRDANGCGDTVSVTVGGAVNSLVLTLDVVEPGCAGANNGSVTAAVSGANGNVSYVWSTTPVQTGAAITGLAAGTYTVTVTDAAGCTATETATLTAAQPVSIDLGNDRTFCAGSSATLNAGAGFAAYAWSTGETTESIGVSASDVYSVTVTNASGCTATDGVAVTVIETPEVLLTADTTIYENNPFALKPEIVGNTQGATYLWLPAEGLSCNNCLSPVANPDDTTTYTLVFTDVNGCVNEASITINVLKGARVYMPNVFSPNGDGSNDILFPLGIGVKAIEWKVFNRWGELVFVTTDFNIGWDGTFKGLPQPAGVYVYVMQVTFMNNISQSYNGSVTLVR